MLKRLTVAVAALFVLASSAFGAGTVPGFSLAQQLDSDGTPLSGCKLYVIQAGTTATPQNPYSDSALTIPLANPLVCDAYGRISQFFVADGNIKLRLTKSTGVQVFSQDGLLVVGASSGGGGGSSVDSTTILATGDFKLVYNVGTLSGFVRCNGRTIGNATSGATERANADTSALFAFLYDADTNLSVSGGRGASSSADYAASKTITLPDCRSRSLVAMSNMGNSDSGRLSTTYFGCTGLVLGCVGGAESHTLATTEIPAHSHALTDPGHNHVTTSVNAIANAAGVTNGSLAAGNNTTGITSPNTATNTTGITMANTGGGLAHAIASPGILVTIYIKL